MKKSSRGLSPSMLRHLMSGLLILTAILHFGVALLGAEESLRTPLLVFGGLFLAAGVYARIGGRTAVLVGILVAALGLVLGGSQYLQRGGPPTLPLMFFIDILIIAVGGLWVTKTRQAARKPAGR
jgi:hypothetical protein